MFINNTVRDLYLYTILKCECLGHYIYTSIIKMSCNHSKAMRMLTFAVV